MAIETQTFEQGLDTTEQDASVDAQFQKIIGHAGLEGAGSLVHPDDVGIVNPDRREADRATMERASAARRAEKSGA